MNRPKVQNYEVKGTPYPDYDMDRYYKDLEAYCDEVEECVDELRDIIDSLQRSSLNLYVDELISEKFELLQELAKYKKAYDLSCEHIVMLEEGVTLDTSYHDKELWKEHFFEDD